jgi:hypothetical protein
MKFKTHNNKYLITIFFFLIFTNSKSQNFDLFIANDHFTQPDIFEFDVYIKTTTSNFNLHTIQQAFTINPAFTPASANPPTISIVQGSTQFNFYNPGLIQQNFSPSLSAFSVSISGAGGCPGMGLVTTLPKRLCTWRIISNNGPFNCVPHNLSMIRPYEDIVPGNNVNLTFSVSRWDPIFVPCNNQNSTTISNFGTYTSITGNTLLNQMNNLPDDKNPCTNDACNSNGIPIHTPITNTGGGENDGLICTEDNCQNGITVHLPVTGPVNDNNLCTSGETCNNGVFNPGNITPIDDGNVCTIDFCNSASGSVSHTQSKEDNNPCTNDFCDGNGVVSHSPTLAGTPGASDNNLCTVDLCDGMSNTLYTSVVIDDGDPCTVDGCISSQGVFHTQGPCFGPTLYAKLFIEGYYTGSGEMNNLGTGGCLYVTGLSLFSTDADYVTISLFNPNALPPIFLNGFVESKTGILKTNGSIQVTFTNAVASATQYWIRITHRNSVETWSKTPVEISATTALQPYDFTNNQTQAYGNNLIDVGSPFGDPPAWAIFSGDISDAETTIIGIQDDVIESQDYSDMESAVYYTYVGYVTEDITGDGIVESADYGLIENNTYFTRHAIRP